MTRKIQSLIGAILLSLIAVSCASAPDLFSDKKRKGEIPCSIELVPDASGTGGSFRLAGPLGKKTWLTGSYSAGKDGETILAIDSLQWFNNWAYGWTEARFDCSGSLALKESANGWAFSVLETPVPGEATAAGIRYRDTVLDPETAIKQFRNRWARIQATAEFLRASALYSGPSASASATGYPVFASKDKKNRGASFREQAGKFLFPEVKGYASADLKATYEKTETKEAEDIKWSPSYTADYFPETLRQIRDGGTMFRDWEESAELFYFACWSKEIFANAGRSVDVLVQDED